MRGLSLLGHSEDRPLARPATDWLWAGLSQILLATVFGAIALTSAHRPAASAAGLLFEAVFYGGFMWLITGKRLKREIEDARVIVDPNIRDCRSAAHVLTLTILATAPILLVVTILSPGSPIVAGIMLGGGALGIALHRWLVTWEAEHLVEVLRVPAWRRRKGVNTYRIVRTTSTQIR
ncbi:MAG TPA: hypothetical protein VIH92_10245 [Solirubrobacteraceae bacterium]